MPRTRRNGISEKSWEESDESSFCSLPPFRATNQKRKTTKNSPRTKKASTKKTIKTSPRKTQPNMSKACATMLQNISNVSTNESETNASKSNLDADDSDPEFACGIQNVVKKSIDNTFYDLSPYDDDLFSPIKSASQQTNGSTNLGQGPSTAKTFTFDCDQIGDTSAENNDSFLEDRNDSDLQFLDTFLQDAAASNVAVVQTPKSKKTMDQKIKMNNLNKIMKETEDLLKDITKGDNTASNLNDGKSSANKKNIVDSSKKSCPICLEVFDGTIQTVSTVCGHIFCMPCIEQIVKTTKKCPICRKAITNKSKYHEIFL